MTQFWRRVWMTCHLARLSSPMTGTRQAFVVTVLLSPLWEIAAAYFLGAVLHASSTDFIALKTLIVSTALLTATSIVMVLVEDKENGILDEVLSRRYWDAAYTLGITAFALVVGAVSFGVSLCVMGLVFPITAVTFIHCVAILPIALLLGCGLGACASWTVNVCSDPFIGINSVVPVYPLAVGTFVSLSQYPGGWPQLLHHVPLASSLASLEMGGTFIVAYDVGASVTLLVIGIFVACWLAARTRHQR